MATQVAKVEEEKQPSELQQRVSGSLQKTTEFFHDVRVELKKVTWPSREDVTSTTGVVIATVAFFGVYLAIVKWLAHKGFGLTWQCSGTSFIPTRALRRK